MNPTNLLQHLSNQFQALQEHRQAGQQDAALAVISTLLQEPLEPLQRSLVLQLQGEILRARGESELALEAWRDSLGLRFSPQLTLLCLESVLLPVVDWEQQDQWTAWMRSLIDEGEGTTLLRWLLQLLQSYPLQQQRDALLDHLDQGDRLGLQQHPQLIALWQRLRRCAAEH